MSPASDISLSWLARHCDAFYIGGTKVGALCGEAVVFTRGNAPKHFFSNVKRHGALLAKGRVVGVQFDALFTESLYFTISRHAIVMAEKLKRVLSEAGIPFYMDSPTNQQFVLLPAARAHELKQRVDFTLWGPAPRYLPHDLPLRHVVGHYRARPRAVASHPQVTHVASLHLLISKNYSGRRFL